MLDRHTMALLDRQYPLRMPQHIAIAALRILGQRTRWGAIEGLGIELLVGFIDEHHAVAAKAEAAAAVFIDAAAGAEAVRRQAVGLLVAPMPEAAGAIGGRNSFQNTPLAPTLSSAKSVLAATAWAALKSAAGDDS